MVTSCALCKEAAIISIPTLIEPLHLCANHTAHPPIDIIQNLFRDSTPDTLLYLLNFVHQNRLLQNTTQEQAQKLMEIETATKYNLVESLQQDRNSLQEHTEELESKLAQAQEETTSLKEENLKLSNLRALLEEHKKAITTDVKSWNTEIVKDIEEANETFKTISADIQGIQDILTKEPEPLKKHKKEPPPLREVEPE